MQHIICLTSVMIVKLVGFRFDDSLCTYINAMYLQLQLRVYGIYVIISTAFALYFHHIYRTGLQ